MGARISDQSEFAHRRWVPGLRSQPRRPVTISVVIADDQALVRGGFVVMVKAAPDMEVVGEAANGAEAVALIRQRHPDVVMMDVRMPVLDGINVANRDYRPGDRGHPMLILRRSTSTTTCTGRCARARAASSLSDTGARDSYWRRFASWAAGEALLAPSITRRLIREFALRPAARCAVVARAA